MTSSVWRHTDPTSSVIWPFDTAYATYCTPSILTKPVSHLVFDIFTLKHFIVMTSPQTSWRLDQLSVWTIETHGRRFLFRQALLRQFLFRQALFRQVYAWETSWSAHLCRKLHSLFYAEFTSLSTSLAVLVFTARQHSLLCRALY